jgi:hypothetical protein
MGRKNSSGPGCAGVIFFLMILAVLYYFIQNLGTAFAFAIPIFLWIVGLLLLVLLPIFILRYIFSGRR